MPDPADVQLALADLFRSMMEDYRPAPAPPANDAEALHELVEALAAMRSGAA